MNLSNLQPASGSTHSEKRIGRGQGSGHGGTSTRGHKGAQSRSGYSSKRGFEGGQMPLARRLPKFGFTNNNKIVNKPINLSMLSDLAAKLNVTVITPEVMLECGYIGRQDRVKILGNGELTLKLDVTAHAFSKSAIEAIQAKQGTVTTL